MDGGVNIDRRLTDAIGVLMWPLKVTFTDQRDIDGLYISVDDATHAIRGVNWLKSQDMNEIACIAHDVANVLRRRLASVA